MPFFTQKHGFEKNDTATTLLPDEKSHGLGIQRKKWKKMEKNGKKWLINFFSPGDIGAPLCRNHSFIQTKTGIPEYLHQQKHASLNATELSHGPEAHNQKHSKTHMRFPRQCAE